MSLVEPSVALEVKQVILRHNCDLVKAAFRPNLAGPQNATGLSDGHAAMGVSPYYHNSAQCAASSCGVFAVFMFAGRRDWKPQYDAGVWQQ